MAGGLGSGLVGDTIGNHHVHGGDDQAVYAYAREDLDTWQTALRRELGNGVFGENVTTSGIDVTNARIGELWRVGSDGLRLEVSRPRIPCRTFAQWLSVQGWIKTFTGAAVPGAYLRVVEPGTVRAGDDIEVVGRPEPFGDDRSRFPRTDHRTGTPAPAARGRGASRRPQRARPPPGVSREFS